MGKNKNLFVVIFALFTILSCSSETITSVSGDVPTPPPTETASLANTSAISILETADNTDAIFIVNGININGEDVVEAAFVKDSSGLTANDFKIQYGYDIFKGYTIAIRQLKKVTSITEFNVKVKNRLGTEILNENVYVNSFHKIYPYVINNGLPIPYPDNYQVILDTVNKEAYVLFKHVVDEHVMNVTESGVSISHNTVTAYFKSFGFNGDFNNVSTSGNFMVNDTDSTFTVDSVSYPNCLLQKSENIDCAIKFTHTGVASESIKFHLRTTEKYEDVVLDLQYTMPN